MRHLMSYYIGMSDVRLSIEDLAAATGISRRAVRFYIQRGLLRPPNGRGRGRHYDAEHLEQLNRILQLQAAGHSLEAIRRIQGGAEALIPPPAPSHEGRPPRARALLTAGLWSRVGLADGVELHVDTAKHNLEAEQLLAIREVVRNIVMEEVWQTRRSDDGAGG